MLCAFYVIWETADSDLCACKMINVSFYTCIVITTSWWKHLKALNMGILAHKLEYKVHGVSFKPFEKDRKWVDSDIYLLEVWSHYIISYQARPGKPARRSRSLIFLQLMIKASDLICLCPGARWRIYRFRNRQLPVYNSIDTPIQAYFQQITPF